MMPMQQWITVLSRVRKAGLGSPGRTGSSVAVPAAPSARTDDSYLLSEAPRGTSGQVGLAFCTSRTKCSPDTHFLDDGPPPQHATPGRRHRPMTLLPK